MKKQFLIITCSILMCTVLYFSSCKSGTSSDANSVTADSGTIAKGQNAFVSNCSGCHNFNWDGIGPELGGVLSKHPADWVKNFIRDPKKVIDSGDTTAK